MTTDIDELIKMLEEKLQEKEAEKSASKKPKISTDSADRFIKKNSIRKGIDRVSNDVIYYTYKRKYTAKMGEEKWSKVHFFRLFNRQFDSVRTGRLRSYLLDGSSFDLTREGIIEAKSYNEQYHHKIGLKTGRIKKRQRRKAFKKA